MASAACASADASSRSVGARNLQSVADSDELARLDASAQAALVRSGRVSPLELVDAAIARIERLNPRLNALVTPDFDRARDRARLVNASGAGPFPGVPYAIKDLLDVKGLRRTSGSRLLRDNVAATSAPLVLRSEDSGLIVLGKTNTPEFALDASTEPLLFGPSRNPWDVSRSPGGSSGGAAVAVSSGMLPMAHASDGGGSIRIPASCCGLFGMKPSRGRMVGSADTDSGVENCVSHSIRDSARLFAWNQRSDAQAPLPATPVVERASPQRLRIGVCIEDVFGRQPSADVRQATLAAAALCERLGHHVAHVRLPVDGEQFMDGFMTAWSGGAEHMLRVAESRNADPQQALEPWTLYLAQHARGLPPQAPARARTTFAQVRENMDALFSAIDVLLSPVVADEPPPLGFLGPQVPGPLLWERLLRYVGYTPIHNVAGTPAMSVPLGRSSHGLPIGTQFAARLGGESMLFALAYELEAAKPWSDLRG